MLCQLESRKGNWSFNKRGCFTTVLLLTIFLSACAVKSPLTKAEQLAHRQNTPIAWVKSPKQETINPAFALSKNLSPTLFWKRNKKGFRSFPLGVNKKDYRLAIANANSGHAYDAYIAALAYWSGYYKPGKYNYSKAKGRDKYEYRYYMKKSASLGLPQANLILLAYGHFPVSGYSKGALLLRYPSYKNYSLSQRIDIIPDIDTARAHFLQAAKHGRYFDQNYNYVGSSLPKEDSITAVLDDWRADMESSSIISKVHNPASKMGSRDMFPARGAGSAENRCKANYAYVLDKARNLREPEICEGRNPSGGYVFVHYTQKLDCPGAGYRDARAYLQGCMGHSKSKKEWDFYFKERMRLYHPRQDQDLKIFDTGLAHYRKTGDKEAVKWVSQLKKKAAKTTMASRDKWAREYEANQKARDIRVANRKAQKAAEKRKQAREEREYGELLERQKARFDAEDKAKQQNWNLTTDVFNDDIDRMKEQAMRNINSQQQRLSGTVNTGRTTLDSKDTQPRSASNNSKDCVHATLGYLPESRYSKSGKPWCDYDKIHRTYKNNLAEARKKNSGNKKDCPTRSKDECGYNGWGVFHCRTFTRPESGCSISK